MARVVFSEDQLDRYFDRVQLPHQHRHFDVSTLSDAQKLDYLNRLQKHHLCSVPWENLSQHYSWHRTVNVKPDHLYNKIVASTFNPPSSSATYSHGTNRGGYCMEVNYFFHLVLNSLKFDTFIAGSRIFRSPEVGYGGWTHCVNIVCIGDVKYMLDGGYGSNGPTFPIPMEDGRVHPHVSTGGTTECRLVFQPIAQHLNSASRVWIYQFRFDSTADWQTGYCFVDLEFIPTDIESMNFSPWQNPQSFFTHKVVAVRFSTSAEKDAPYSPTEAAYADDAQIDGAVILNHFELKWRRNGKTVVRKQFQEDKDRVEALEQYFGIQLAAQDVDAIQGTAAEIRSTLSFSI